MITDKQADAGATCATVLEHEAETLRAEPTSASGTVKRG